MINARPGVGATIAAAPSPVRERVVVAMSGGVDSSVVAALLKAQGYDVVGVTLQLYDAGRQPARRGACCAGQDIYDARDVADRLQIPHYVLNYQDIFQDRVIRPFAEGYARAETPVPCVACNQSVKFLELLDTATELGARRMATGHYVRLTGSGGGSELRRARDIGRDQSYFLFRTTREQLSRLWFPLGDLPKPDVRRLAQEFGLKVADKADSQDICFVPRGGYANVVEKMIPAAGSAGPIVHVDGRELGRHRGLHRFTVGQRRGLGLTRAEGAAEQPLYVIRLDRGANSVIVGPRSALATRTVLLRDVNWIGHGFQGIGELDLQGELDLEIAARVRSTRPPARARLRVHRGTVSVELAADEFAVAPGQACVFYGSDEPDARVLGGGFIAEAAPGRRRPGS